MLMLLFVLSVFALLYGIGVQLVAKSAAHEIEAGTAFVVFAALLVGSALVERLDIIRRELHDGARRAQ